jgi:toxin YoeB
MKLLWTEKAWEDYLHWRSNDPDTLKKINVLIADIQRTPFRGLGKPEALKFALSGAASRKSIDWSIAYRESLPRKSWKSRSAAITIDPVSIREFYR